MSDFSQTPQNVVKTADVIGVKVKNNDDETLGKIEEVVLDKLSGQARYVVLSFGGILSLGDKLFALPWKAISYNKEQECFILEVDKNELEDAPGFDKNSWPDMADRTWEKAIHDYYGTKAYWRIEEDV